MLVVLFVGAFVMGCAEMLVVGMLDLIAVDLAVSVPAAGALVTANALGLAIGGPLLTFLTTRFDRRRVLHGHRRVRAGQPAARAGGRLSALPAARVVIGAVQGLFIAAAMVTATSIVPPERSGRAMAMVISGFATSSALGLPLGTLLGQAVGWRGSFGVVVAVGVVVLVVAVVVLPSVPTRTAAERWGRPGTHSLPGCWPCWGWAADVRGHPVGADLPGAVPARVTGISGPGVGAFLLTYGVATAVGSFAGGRFADSDAARALIVGTIGVTGSLVGMRFLGAIRC